MENVRQFNPRDMADDDDLTRTPPHDAEAEALVCGIIMHSQQAYTDCAAIIDRADIYQPSHRLIWDVVAGMTAEDKPLHPVTVKAEIAQMKRLREVGDGHLVDHLGATTITAAMAASFAEQIAEAARRRRHEEHAVRIRVAIARGDSGEELDQLHNEFQRGEQLRTTAGHGPGHLTSALLDWDPFFGTDFGDVLLLPGELMAPGQQIALIGDGKAGKSLFTQEWAWRMATGQAFLGDTPQDPVSILYVDAENGQEQIQERFLSFGAGPGRMGLLSYASFPQVRPLDTAAGGADVMALAQSVEAQLVVIDTVSRFISGPENDADTWLSLYRHTLLPLKRRGIGSARLDHFGKDNTRGGRGSSAKTQDVDHVWELAAQGGGALTLKRTHTRTGIGPDNFLLLRQAQRDGDSWRPGGTRHVVMSYEHGMEAVPGTVENVIAELDKAGVPNDWGAPRCSKQLADLGVRAAKAKIEEAVRKRKNRPSPDLPPHLPYQSVTETSPDPRGEDHKTPGQPSPGEVAGTLPPATTAPPSPHPPTNVGGGGAARGGPTNTTKPTCDVCNRPLNPDWATRGYTTHLGCDPTTGSYPEPPEPA